MERSHRARGYLAAPSIDIRPMTKEEAPLLAKSGFRSFRSADPEAWERRVFSFDDNPLLAPEDTLVARMGGTIAGHASGYRFTMAFGGHDVPVRGIAAVAVLPEFRRRGVAEALMVGLHRQMRRRGEALSMLYAFRNSFYRKMGYGTVEWIEELRVAPDQLPASPLRRNVRTLERERDEATVLALYEKWRAGRVGPFVRSKRWWQQRVWERTSHGALYLDPETRKPRGYVLWEVPNDPPYPRQRAIVRELVALDPSAWRGLVGLLESLADQFRLIAMTAPRGEGAMILKEIGFAQPIEPMTMSESTGLVNSGALLRLVDVPAALALHPGPQRNGARGRVGLDLDDPIVAVNGRGLDVLFGARGARASAGRAARDRIAMPVDRLAQVYLGAVSARVLLARGLATGSERAALLIDRAFAGPPCWLSPLNGF